LSVDQGQNGRVISPGYTDDPSGTLSQRESEQPPAHVVPDNVQASTVYLLLENMYYYHFCYCILLNTDSMTTQKVSELANLKSPWHEGSYGIGMLAGCSVKGIFFEFTCSLNNFKCFHENRMR